MGGTGRRASRPLVHSYPRRLRAPRISHGQIGSKRHTIRAISTHSVVFSVPTSRSFPRILSAVLLLALAACQSIPPAPPGAAVQPAVLSAPVETALGTAEQRGRSVMVVDMDSGRSLYEDSSEAMRFPASLTKMMVIYMAFEEIEAGRLSMSDAMAVSANAASRPPSKLGLAAGSSIRVHDAITALAVKSANDVAVVVAEHLAGSEGLFAARMTAKARELGMARTRFVNASGLPDLRQVTTARDMAILGRALKTRFARYSSVFAIREFTYGGRHYEATNRLLGVVPGVDGLKTGYINIAGHNIVVSARAGGRRIIVVVLGGRTRDERDMEAAALVRQYL